MIRVAIDIGPLASGDAVRGVGFYTQELAKHLKKTKDFEVQLKDFKKSDLSEYDIIHYPKFHPYFFSLPFFKRGKSIITIHDLIYLIYPKAYPPGIRGKLKFLIQKQLIKKVDAVIAVSETSKKDIVRFLGVPQEKIFVIHNGYREIFKPIEDKDFLDSVKKKYSLPDKFILYVGDVNYNKNILGLVQAAKITKVPLVIVGKQAASTDFDRSHPENKPFVEFLNKYEEDKDIIRLGFVEDAELVGIYNLASVYCQPSFYEGFGLPILEAFASGCPVVAAKTQALVEIGEPACLFADPKDPKDIAAKLATVLEDKELRGQLIETGKVLIGNYSWDKTAKETTRVYRRVIGK